MKTLFRLLLSFSFILLVVTACNKNQYLESDFFKIDREKVTPSSNGVTINGSYDFAGTVKEMKLNLGLQESLIDADIYPMQMEGTDFSVTVEGLKPATTYYYCYNIDFGSGKPYLMETKSFKTLETATAPTVLTLDVLVIDSTTFRIDCKVESDGGQQVTECGVCWNTYGNPNLSDETLHYSQAGVGEYSCKLTNLTENTKYYVCAYAKNATGTSYGEVLEFRTGSSSSLPHVLTIEITEITYHTALCLGNVTSDGGLELLERGVCWGLEPDPTINVNHAVAEGTVVLGTFTVDINGLSPNTTYHARCYATNERGTSYGEELTFTTTGGLPTVTTAAITDITNTTAKGGGEVTDEGTSPVTERGICWSTNHNPTTSNNHESSGTGIGSYTIQITGLTSNETYFVRAYATNTQGTAYGAEVEFTAMEGLPEVQTIDVTNITSTTARAHGNVTNQGSSNVTERGVCWSTQQSPTIEDDHANNGTGTGTYEINMTNLTPGTTYHVRAYATNALGTTYGDQKDFTTTGNIPTVVTGQIEGTKVHGEVTDGGGSIVTEKGICWSTNPTPTIHDSHESAGSGLGSFSVELNDLEAGTTYYVSAYATNSAGTGYGEVKTLTIETKPPTVITGEVSNITPTSALGRGNVTDDGGAEVTERGLCWSTNHNPTISNSYATSGTGLGNYTVSMNNLTPNTQYYVRAYAKNSVDIQYGEEIDFRTSQNISTPTVTTSNVSNVTQNTAMGGGNVTNDGGAPVFERGICWSTNQNPTISNNHANNGSGTGSYSVNMTNLTPNTTYYVRAYATNSAGTAYGDPVNFTTLGGQSYTIAVSANPSNGGTVNGGGTFASGQSCTVQATAHSGYRFSNWTENNSVVSYSASYTFTVNSNRNLVANFAVASGGDQTFTVNGVSFTMKRVEGGTFWMGAQHTNPNGQNYDSEAYDREGPVHSVTLSTFYMGQTEVTQELWEAVMGSNPSSFSGTNLPVENVSWNTIVNEFLPALNALTGQNFRLPTEAEWEFAARGGNQSHGYKYAGSNTVDNVAWHANNSYSQPHPVGTKSPNELGLYDMSGNVWEWCNDWYGDYSSGSQTNPQGPSNGTERVNKGGGWYGTPWFCRVSYRGYGPSSETYSYLGLRLAY